MEWNKTIASECRWSSIAEEIWGDADILWEDSVSDYQGHASILAKHPDGRYSFYEWTYGSCSGCDSWEDQPTENIRNEMLESAMWFTSKAELRTWFTMLELTKKNRSHENESKDSRMSAIARELDTPDLKEAA